MLKWIEDQCTLLHVTFTGFFSLVLKLLFAYFLFIF